MRRALINRNRQSQKIWCFAVIAEWSRLALLEGLPGIGLAHQF
jgi:hypothetical protein